MDPNSENNWPFDTVLVANRGEIALRIVRTVKARGLRAAVVFHSVDAASPAVAEADCAYEITGETPVAAYLDADQILDIAKSCGSVAVHPGYGFLSERAEFARACERAGVVFVGPRPDVIELLGDKVKARAFVEQHGFPVAPSAIEDDDPSTFVERAFEVGFPLLIKPAAGGGGKGMRVVRDPEQLSSEIERARSEGIRYFGDGRLYVERFVENPRHIEVQVLGDAHGNVVHLFERECSVQRRYQKIIEESPSPSLNDEVRRQICETAAGIARSAGYSNAGTVEFIFGANNFYFLEVNTRLQVEHPVTEQTLGIDLVELQLRVAAGEVLPLKQDDVHPRAHAIEFRIYAEDPSRVFAPTTGPILAMREPVGDGVRVDAGFSPKQQITAAFDPMLAKLIVTAPDRGQAIDKAVRALENYVLLGCKTNIDFLHRLARHPAFLNGEIHTGYLDSNPDIAAEPEIDPETMYKVFAVAAMNCTPMRAAADAIPSLHAMIGTWRN